MTEKNYDLSKSVGNGIKKCRKSESQFHHRIRAGRNGRVLPDVVILGEAKVLVS